MGSHLAPHQVLQLPDLGFGKIETGAGHSLDVNDELPGISTREVSQSNKRTKQETGSEESHEKKNGQEWAFQGHCQHSLVPVEEVGEAGVEPGIESPAPARFDNTGM